MNALKEWTTGYSGQLEDWYLSAFFFFFKDILHSAEWAKPLRLSHPILTIPTGEGSNKDHKYAGRRS